MDYPKDPLLTQHDLFIFAGETSGDLHGEALIQNLRALHPNITLFGVGGPRMRAAGMECILEMEQFQVMGFVAVFLSLPKLIRHFYFLARVILSHRPKAVLFIDYPGFALRLERHLKKRHFTGKIIHYICPSVWAWGKKRIPLMEKTLDLLISIFPFEKKCFSPSFPIEYVGNPLVSRISTHKYRPLDLPLDKKIISLFPGSRIKEIKLNFPLQLKTLEHLMKKDPEVLGAISVSQERFIPLLTNYLDTLTPHLKEKVRFVPIDRTYDLMTSSFLALAKSGTVTLELALHKVPTAVIYRISPLDLFIAKNIFQISLPFYCIANIILQKEVFKEFIGPYAQEDNLFPEAEKLLQDLSYRKERIELCQKVIDELGDMNASRQTATLLIQHLFT
ncbi:MAG: lipid-A-disaccharide synthase [Chlamydiota bacterium]